MGGALLIRADAGSAVGVGHVMRMIALAEAWRDSKGTVALLGELPSALAARVTKAGIELVGSQGDAATTAETARRLGARWVVADGYHFDEAWQRSVRAAARLVVVDDNAENQPYLADAVLNANAHATEALYSRRAPHTRLLLGASYVLIRSELRQARPPTTGVAPVASRWLVTFGGADPTDATGRLLHAINATGAKGFEVEVLVGSANPRIAQYEALAAKAPVKVTLTVNPPDVAPSMLRADLAVAAAGSTTWELALLGVPAALVVAADNQTALAASVAARGAAVLLGDARTTAPTAWLEALLALSRDSRRRSQLVASARALVDGEGARRVVRALNEDVT